jgi:hypothetical protein
MPPPFHPESRERLRPQAVRKKRDEGPPRGGKFPPSITFSHTTLVGGAARPL